MNFKRSTGDWEREVIGSIEGIVEERIVARFTQTHDIHVRNS